MRPIALSNSAKHNIYFDHAHFYRMPNRKEAPRSDRDLSRLAVLQRFAACRCGSPSDQAPKNPMSFIVPPLKIALRVDDKIEHDQYFSLLAHESR